WRVSLHFLPTVVRNSTAFCHSSKLGSISRMNACRWRTRASDTWRTRGALAFSNLSRTAAVIVFLSKLRIVDDVIWGDGFYAFGSDHQNSGTGTRSWVLLAKAPKALR